MSYVCDTILTTPILYNKEKVIEDINLFFKDDQRGFVDVDSVGDGKWYGGAKALQCEVFIGAFNCLDLEGLVSHLKKIDWGDLYGHAVQLIAKDENDTEFRIITIVQSED